MSAIEDVSTRRHPDDNNEALQEFNDGVESLMVPVDDFANITVRDDDEDDDLLAADAPLPEHACA